MFWWPGIKKEIEKFVYACMTWQKSKIECQKSLDLVQPLSIPKRKQENISMDFVSGLPRTVKNCDTTWVIMDRLTKFAHFILMRLDYPLERLVKLYIKRIVSLHSIPSSIISDKDSRLTSRFSESLQMALGTKLHMSYPYHPQTDGQTNRTIQLLEDLLRVCVLEQEGA